MIVEYLSQKGISMPANKVYSPVHKSEARDLRKFGLSLGEISIELAIPKNIIQ